MHSPRLVIHQSLLHCPLLVISIEIELLIGFFIDQNFGLLQSIRDTCSAVWSTLTVDEAMFQLTRREVAAQLQSILYYEVLPLILGESWAPPYSGYKPEAAENATIADVFAAVGFRFGHSIVTQGCHQSVRGEWL